MLITMIIYVVTYRAKDEFHHPIEHNNNNVRDDANNNENYVLTYRYKYGFLHPIEHENNNVRDDANINANDVLTYRSKDA
jgi:hypothetical protein